MPGKKLHARHLGADNPINAAAVYAVTVLVTECKHKPCSGEPCADLDNAVRNKPGSCSDLSR
jgi:hypothetical protein